MGEVKAWNRSDLPAYLRGAGCGCWLGALVIIPDVWFVAICCAAFGATLYSLAVVIERHAKHDALMSAPSVRVPSYELKGEIIDYDQKKDMYHVWTPAHGSVSSGWFKAGMLEPCDRPLTVEEGGAAG